MTRRRRRVVEARLGYRLGCGVTAPGLPGLCGGAPGLPLCAIGKGDSRPALALLAAGEYGVGPAASGRRPNLWRRNVPAA